MKSIDITRVVTPFDNYDVLSICKLEGVNQHIEANAKLIAAAPELLEALQLFKEIDKEYRGVMPVLLRGFRDKAEAAIKKATV